jgi:hypothetical protein
MSDDHHKNMDANVNGNVGGDFEMIKPIGEHSLHHLAEERRGREQQPVDKKKIMREGLSEVCIRSENFAIRDIPLREAVLGRWFRRGSLGFIFGKRGTGKT